MSKVSTCQGSECLFTFASCFPYKCNEVTGSCPISCKSHNDCASSGAVCVHHMCRAAVTTSCEQGVLTKQVVCEDGDCATSYASCFPYRCRSGACAVKKCKDGGDCAEGAICSHGRCTAERWSCDSRRLKNGKMQRFATNGRDEEDCYGYVCVNGRCLISCTSTADCNDDSTCNAHGKCELIHG